MSKYRRMLALVTVNSDSLAVAQRALQLSRAYGATLALATVIDARPGIDSDRIELLSATEMGQAHMRDVKEKLEQMTIEIGCDGGCEIIVCRGSRAKVVAELTNSWRPDLVLVDARAPCGMEQDCHANSAYDVLLVHNGRTGFAGRMINALTATL